MKFKLLTVAFLILVTLSLVVRLQRLDFPLSYGFSWGDGTRDYLVANHILNYRELPNVGPFNLLYDSGIRNPPLYFYFLALFLIPFNNILMLGFVNILLQIGVIILIFFTCKKLFGFLTGLTATAFFSFNPEVLHQSDFIWQPNLMQFFAYLALLLIVYFYFERKYLFLILSTVSLVVAFVLHNSAFPWIWPFLIIAYLLSKKQKKLFTFLGTIFVFIILLSLFYLPSAIFLIQNNQLLHTNSSDLVFSYAGLNIPVYVQNINQYLTNLYSYSLEFLKAFNINNWWIILILILTLSYFFKSKDSKNTKVFVILLFILLILPLVFASFFNKIKLHYLTLSFGVLAIFLSKILTSLPKFKLLSVVLVFLLFKNLSFDFEFLYLPHTPFANLRLMDQISQSITTEVRGQYSFQVKSYAQEEEVTFEYPVLSTLLLVPLEEKLKQKMTKVSDFSPYNHIQTGGSDYLLLTCHSFTKKSNIRACLETFKAQYPNYDILKSLHEGFPISVFLAKNKKS